MTRHFSFEELTLGLTTHGGSGTNLAPHVHEFQSAFVVLCGSYWEYQRGCLMRRDPGSVGLRVPGERHGRVLVQPGSQGLSITSHGVGLLAVLFERLTSPREARGVELLRCALELQRAAAHADADASLTVTGLTYELISRATQSMGQLKRRPPWLQDVEAYLREERRPASLDAIAQMIGRDPGYVARAFRTARGCTIGEFARRSRVERAAISLRKTDRPIAEIAAIEGFADQSHFARIFRAAFGVTPSEYRRTMAKHGGLKGH